ncbi:MAG: hypothetical protein IJF61_06520 [Clostridia bacterium]|nr:hypothetical protein [Clostridia bacterium]
MKSKLLAGALALMVVAGGLVGCGTVEEGVEQVVPEATAPTTAGTNATANPSTSSKEEGGLNIGNDAEPNASAPSDDTKAPDAPIAKGE